MKFIKFLGALGSGAILIAGLFETITTIPAVAEEIKDSFNDLRKGEE